MADAPEDQLMDAYRSIIERSHPAMAGAWPLLSGFDLKMGRYGKWIVFMFEHTGITGIRETTGIGALAASIVGVKSIDAANKHLARANLERVYRLGPQDGVVFVDEDGGYEDELQILTRKHEFAMNVAPAKIFLSHAGVDKPLVREFSQMLALLGFEPWLDEDAMPAGTELERGLLRGFNDSCAAVFFVTPNFTDENYLKTEVDYAIQQKRTKEDRFAIITLAFTEGGKTGAVPELLRRYVYKEPKTRLEALREILRALPLEITGVRWKT
jgi:TIR domain